MILSAPCFCYWTFVGLTLTTPSTYNSKAGRFASSGFFYSVDPYYDTITLSSPKNRHLPRKNSLLSYQLFSLRLLSA